MAYAVDDVSVPPTIHGKFHAERLSAKVDNVGAGAAWRWARPI